MTDTVSRLVVEIDFDDKNFRLGVRGATRDLQKLKSVIGLTNTGMKKQERHVNSLTASFRHTVVTLGLLREALRTAWHMTGGLVMGVVKVNAEFERLGVLLQGMSKGTTEIERAADAADQFNKVMTMAKSAPFTVKELTNSWVKFKSVGLDPADGSMRSLVDAVARFGGTDDILHRATIAVQQMAGKGVISMEELRQQMGEAVPQSLVLLARGMNMSVGEMVDKISKGSVEARSALRKLFSEFELTFGGSSQRLMETFVGSMARLTTVFQLTLNEMGQTSGLFAVVKGAVQDLIVELERPEIRRFGIDVAIGMKTVVESMLGLIEKTRTFLKEYGSEVLAVVKAIAAWRIASMAMMALRFDKFIAFLAAEIPLITTRLGLAGLAMKGFSAQAALASVSVKGLLAGVRALLLTNPVGWISLIVGGLVWWKTSQDDVTEATEEGIEAIKRYREAADPEAFEQAARELDVMRAKLIAHSNAVEAATVLALENDGIISASEQAGIDMMISMRTGMEMEIESLEALIEDSTTGAARRAADAAAREMQNTFREGMQQQLNIVRRQDTELDTMFRNGEITEKQRLERRLENWEEFIEAQKAYVTQQLSEQMTALERVESAMLAATDERKKELEADKEAILSTIRLIGTTAVDERVRVLNALAAIRADNEYVTGDKKALEKQVTAMETYFQSVSSRFAGVQAQLQEGMKETEKFKALVESGRFGDQESWPNEMKELFEAILEVVGELDDATEDLKNKKTLDAAMKNLAGQLAQVREEAELYQEAIDDQATEVAGNRVRKFRRMIESLRAQLVAAGVDMSGFNEVADELLKTVQDVEVNKEILDVNNQLRELELEGIQNLRDRNALEIEHLEDAMELFLIRNAEAENIEELKQLYEELIQKKKEAFENSTPIKRMFREWEDAIGNLEEASTGWISNFVDEFVNGIMEGKFAFKDFAKSVLADIAKIIMRAWIARIALMAIGAGGGSTAGASAGASSGGSGMPGGGPFGFAMGGIMTPDGELPLQRYARGGIATKPQVAVFGEGDMNEAYVPLPDGRSIPVTVSAEGNSKPPEAKVEVNVINESGTEVEAEQQGGAAFDGEKYVLDVVLRAVRRPGNFRDGMQGAMR